MSEQLKRSCYGETALISIPDTDYPKLIEGAAFYIKRKLQEDLTDFVTTSFCEFLKNPIIASTESNEILWNIANLFPQEFEVAKSMVFHLNQTYNGKLNECHILTLTKQIVAAKFHFSYRETERMITLIIELCKLVEEDFKIEFDFTSITGHSYVEHMKYLAFRILTNQMDTSGIENWGKEFRRKYIAAYHCANNIGKYIQTKYKFLLSEAELQFLTLHIQMVVSGVKRELS